MNSGVGLLGAFVLAIGGAISFGGLYFLLEVYSGTYSGLLSFISIDSPSLDLGFIGFVSFLLIGIGLWFIVLSGKSDQ